MVYRQLSGKQIVNKNKIAPQMKLNAGLKNCEQNKKLFYLSKSSERSVSPPFCLYGFTASLFTLKPKLVLETTTMLFSFDFIKTLGFTSSSTASYCDFCIEKILLGILLLENFKWQHGVYKFRL